MLQFVHVPLNVVTPYPTFSSTALRLLQFVHVPLNVVTIKMGWYIGIP